MSAATPSRRTPFEGFWPWPGNVFLVLFAGWAFYMGSASQAVDLRHAFYGLGAVSVLALLFGLRAAFDPALRAPRHDNVAAERSARIEALRRGEGIRSDDASRPPHSRLDAAPQPPVDVARTERLAADEGEAQSSPAVPPTPPALGSLTQTTPQGSDLEPLDPDVEPVTGLRQLEAALNREKAERGAMRARRDGIGPDEAALERRLESYLTIDMFNDALNKQLLPIVNKMIAERVSAATRPDALWEKIGAASGAPGSSGSANGAAEETKALRGSLDALTERVSKLQGEVEASSANLTKEREALREEVRSARELAEKALRTAASREETQSQADLAPDVAALREAQEDDRRAIEALREALGEAAAANKGPLELAEVHSRYALIDRRVSAGLEEARTLTHAVREAITTVTRQVTDIGGRNEALVGRVEAIGRTLRSGARRAGEGVQGEVQELRSALTTIIEQNREIRAQQERLSARLDEPRDG